VLDVHILFKKHTIQLTVKCNVYRKTYKNISIIIIMVNVNYDSYKYIHRRIKTNRYLTTIVDLLLL